MKFDMDDSGSSLRSLCVRIDSVMVWTMERMDVLRMDRNVLIAEESERRGRPRFGWADGVMVALGSRRMPVWGGATTNKG